MATGILQSKLFSHAENYEFRVTLGFNNLIDDSNWQMTRKCTKTELVTNASSKAKVSIEEFPNEMQYIHHSW